MGSRNAATNVTTSESFAGQSVFGSLFRNAVHCAVGFCLVIAATHGRAWKTSIGRVVAFGGLTLLLLTPSLLWVERYAGLGEYFRNGLALARREMQRTDRGWPAFTSAELDSASDAGVGVLPVAGGGPGGEGLAGVADAEAAVYLGE